MTTLNAELRSANNNNNNNNDLPGDPRRASDIHDESSEETAGGDLLTPAFGAAPKPVRVGNVPPAPPAPPLETDATLDAAFQRKTFDSSSQNRAAVRARLQPQADLVRYLYEATTLRLPPYHYAALWGIYLASAYLYFAVLRISHMSELSALFLTIAFYYTVTWLAGDGLPVGGFLRGSYKTTPATAAAAGGSGDPFIVAADAVADAGTELQATWAQLQRLRAQSQLRFTAIVCTSLLAAALLFSLVSGSALLFFAAAVALAAPAVVARDLHRQSWAVVRPHLDAALARVRGGRQAVAAPAVPIDVDSKPKRI